MRDRVRRQPVARRSGARSRADSIVPTVRLMLRIGSVELDRLAPLERRARSARSAGCRAPCRGRGPASARSGSATVGGTSGLCRICGEVDALRLPVLDGVARRRAGRRGRPSRRPCGSRARAMISRSSSAMNVMKLTTCSGLPANFLRSTGSCVAMPTGQVLRWQTRIMMQPDATSAARGEAELLGAEQRGDRDVAAGLQLAVGLDADAAAQVVHHQHLLRLGEAELPRDAGVLDRRERRRAGAAVVAADQHDVGLAPWRRRRRPCRRRPRRPASR